MSILDTYRMRAYNRIHQELPVYDTKELERYIAQSERPDACCGLCKHFAIDPWYVREGVCTRYAPHPIYPQQTALDYCGDFEPRCTNTKQP